MKLSFSLLLFLVIKIVNCIPIVLLCLRNQRDAYESTYSRSILEYNLGTVSTIAEALHVGKEFEGFFFFKFHLVSLKLYRTGNPK